MKAKNVFQRLRDAAKNDPRPPPSMVELHTTAAIRRNRLRIGLPEIPTMDEIKRNDKLRARARKLKARP